MAKISYDGQSFSLDGRRLWLVSGAMHYPRIPRGLWRDRIRAAKQAGLNCIETYGFWNAHEKKTGQFDFTDNLDVRHFVELIADEGMYCIVRPGPYVCAEWDNGGLPVWLHRVKPDRRSGPMRLREGNGPFLSAASRYLSEFIGQLKDLQITSPVGKGKPPLTPTTNAPGRAAGGFVGQGGGPIVMVQVENEWFCQNPEQESLYHQQLIRLLREAGVDVPLNVCNQLWQEVDGTIHSWNASDNLTTNLRQLTAVQPGAPRLVSEYWTGWFDQWGTEHADKVGAHKHFARMVGILAAGAQYNLYMFHGGTNFGFTGGRTVGGPDSFMTTSYDYDAPLLEAGGRGEKYDATKRVSTFASQFGTLLAHLEPARQPAVVDPDQADRPLSVVHLVGSRGGVVFVLKSPKDRTRHTTLLLPNGLSLPVPLGDEPTTWLPLDARLSNGVTLDYSNLSPLAFVDDRLLVVVGPAGSEGVLSIDGLHVDVKVPGGKTPAVEQIDQMTLLVLNSAMADASYATLDGWVVGCDGLDTENQPRPRKGWPTQFRIALDGTVMKVKTQVTRKPTAPKFGSWSVADTHPYLDGSTASYKPIKGPMSFEKLGNDEGYGWVHLELPKASGATPKVLSPGSGDRLHVYRDGKFDQLLGHSIGGNRMAPASLRVGGKMTLLIDNLGRFNYGQRVGEQKGLLAPFYAVKPVKLPAPKRTGQPSPDPFTLRGYVQHQRHGDVRAAEGLSWTVKPAKRKPMILELDGLPVNAVLKVNGQPVDIWHHHDSAGFQRFLLDPADDGPFTGGQNAVELALFEPLPTGVDVLKTVALYQTTSDLTAKAKWSFSPWRLPDAEEFTDASFTAKNKPSDQPTWYRTTFSVASTRCPLFAFPKGMSKGQLFLNGRNLGRYFIQTRQKKTVPPQTHYYLPEPWLNVEGDNELLFFDEHGFPPTQAKLVYNEHGPYQS
ncbi:MAG: beta-galactosidase [Planctomycetota bacterium]